MGGPGWNRQASSALARSVNCDKRKRGVEAQVEASRQRRASARFRLRSARPRRALLPQPLLRHVCTASGSAGGFGGCVVTRGPRHAAASARRDAAARAARARPALPHRRLGRLDRRCGRLGRVVGAKEVLTAADAGGAPLRARGARRIAQRQRHGRRPARRRRRRLGGLLLRVLAGSAAAAFGGKACRCGVSARAAAPPPAASAPRDGHEEAEVMAALLAAAPLFPSVVEHRRTRVVPAAAFRVGFLAVARVTANALAQQRAVVAARRHARAGTKATQTRCVGACGARSRARAPRTHARARRGCTASATGRPRRGRTRERER